MQNFFLANLAVTGPHSLLSTAIPPIPWRQNPNFLQVLGTYILQGSLGPTVVGVDPP